MASARTDLSGQYNVEMASARTDLSGQYNVEMASARTDLSGQYNVEMASARTDLSGQYNVSQVAIVGSARYPSNVLPHECLSCSTMSRQSRPAIWSS